MLEHPRYLQIFLLMLTALLVWMIVYIIVAAVKYDYSARTLLWDIILCILLGIALVFTADVTRGAKAHGGPHHHHAHHHTVI